MQHLINAAEPIDAGDLEAFDATFGGARTEGGGCGLPRGVVFPTYGLAEHTVFVCSGGTQRLRVDKRALEVTRWSGVWAWGWLGMRGCGVVG